MTVEKTNPKLLRREADSHDELRSDPRTAKTMTAHDLGTALFGLIDAMNGLTGRVRALERIERKLNVPVVALLAGILLTLVYMARKMP
ncbi:MAG: hypothetical protein JWM74_1799 [Myxococcaceae bacterium]|nr:hypothetical protein [Myxococcaceae bacterium]